MPPVVYVPCREDSNADEPIVVRHQLEDGRSALLVYSSLDRLVELCGDGQRWTLARTEGLQATFGPYDVLVLDQPLNGPPAGGVEPGSGRPEVGSGRPGRAAVPPVVYLPLRGSGEERVVEIRRLKDGRPALLAYTALDRLAEACGPNQPRTALPTASLGEIKRSQPYEVVIFDMHVPEQVQVLLPIAMCGSDPNLVLALIEHYRTHPGDRAELAGPEVIDRLRRGDFAAWPG